MTAFDKATSVLGALGWFSIAITWCLVAGSWGERVAAIVISTLVIAWVVRDARKRLRRSREATSTFTFARQQADPADLLRSSMTDVVEAAMEASGVPFEITSLDESDGNRTLVGVIRDRGDSDARDRFIAAFDAELLRVDGPPVERIVTIG